MSSTHRVSLRERLQLWLPKLVLSPSVALVFLFVYGFILFTLYLSFSDSRILPSYSWVGFENYEKLWRLSHWKKSLTNLLVFAAFYIGIAISLGLALAIAGPENSWRRHPASHLSLPHGAKLHRNGHGVEMDFLTQVSAWKTPCTCGAGPVSNSTGLRTVTSPSTP